MKSRTGVLVLRPSSVLIILLSMTPTALGLSPKTLTAFRLQTGSTAHDLRSGPLVITDSRTIRIPNLYYDGLGPDAFFIIGTGPPPLERPPATPGIKIPNEKGSYEVLKAYTGETILLRLPSDLSLDSFDWIAVYCIKYRHTFGYAEFGRPLGVPEAVRAGARTLPAFTLQNGQTAHGLKSDPVIVNDTKTITIPGLYYDGKGPDAFFMVGYGKPPVERPSATPGHKIPNEKGRCGVLEAYRGETIVLRLPDNYTVDSVDWLAVYCIYYKHNFGHILFEHPMDVPMARDGSEGPEPCGQARLGSSLALLLLSSLFCLFQLTIFTHLTSY